MTWSMVDFCEHGSVKKKKHRKFRDQVNNYQLIKKDLLYGFKQLISAILHMTNHKF
jgi:hypothetical protein